MIRLAIACFALAGAGLANAQTLQLEGTVQQGGLVIGTAAPGAAVTFQGRDLRVSPNGRFVFGFGRDAAPSAALDIRWPDGRTERRLLDVAQRVYQEQRIDGLPPKSVTPPASVLARIKSDSRDAVAARRFDTPETWFADGFIWPTVGRITGVYGSRRVLNGQPRRPHFGIDIAAPTGTPVKAPAAGIVRLIKDMYYSGWTVVVDHGYGVSSTFLHMDRVDVAVGDQLAPGQAFGTVGSTGRSTGPHLDWRVNWFKERVDAATLVGPMPQS